MKFTTDILKTILDGMFILAVVLALAGFELLENPPVEETWTPPAMFEFWLVPKGVK